MGDAGPFLVSNGLTVVAWGQEYKLVARANQQLSGMKNGEAMLMLPFELEIK